MNAVRRVAEKEALPVSGADLIGRNIARLRRARQLDVPALAALLSRSAADIEALERGQLADLRLDDLDNLAGALGVQPHELFAPGLDG